jgi:glycosyltransferase involved in cell wall biosynthesis
VDPWVTPGGGEWFVAFARIAQMRIAFYAPLKPPDHETPSGDRRVARLFLAALRRAGHHPFVASRLRSFDPDGARQAQIAARGRRTAERLIAFWRARPETAPGLWFTYHLYYKAPDWLGPAVSAALGIPYVVAEASFATKRAGGAWDIGHRAVEAALRRADRVIGLNTADRAAVMPLLAHPDRFVALAPFLDADAYTAPRKPTTPPLLVTVAMMRPGDKLASYRVLAAALATLLDRAWTLEVIGDGPARAEVTAALALLGERVRFAGALGEAEIARRLAAADLFVWPAINEAFGMALLEAQASGLPVVAGRGGGVGDVVADGVTGLLAPPGDAGAFAEGMRALLDDPARRAAFGAAARDKIRREHDLPAAARRLGAIIAALTRARAA